MSVGAFGSVSTPKLGMSRDTSGVQCLTISSYADDGRSSSPSFVTGASNDHADTSASATESLKADMKSVMLSSSSSFISAGSVSARVENLAPLVESLVTSRRRRSGTFSGSRYSTHPPCNDCRFMPISLFWCVWSISYGW